jgi:hypothetical protein
MREVPDLDVADRLHDSPERGFVARGQFRFVSQNNLFFDSFFCHVADFQQISSFVNYRRRIIGVPVVNSLSMIADFSPRPV